MDPPQQERRSMSSVNKLMTIDEVAEYLQLPKSTIYQWRTRRDGPPGYKLGRHVRYRRSEVDAWVEQQRDDGGSSLYDTAAVNANTQPGRLTT